VSALEADIVEMMTSEGWGVQELQDLMEELALEAREAAEAQTSAPLLARALAGLRPEEVGPLQLQRIEDLAVRRGAPSPAGRDVAEVLAQVLSALVKNK
jgi:hypothetical protein